jgi:hypothetical protein
MTLDPRLNAMRGDLADIRLHDRIAAPRYAAGKPARVAVGLAPVRHTPHAAAALDTFFHYGEGVDVFDESGGYAWCQSRRDSYVGYVDAAALSPGETPAPTHYVATLGAYRYAQPDLRSAVVDFLPRHSPVTAIETGLECRGTAYIRLDISGFIPAGCLATKPPRSPDLAAAAALYIGCPYLWGGRSFLGIDCSGLVQEAFRDLGVAVPRDSDLQRDAIGGAVAMRGTLELRRNDLIFVPGHVMICADADTVIHAYGGDMRVRQDKLAALMQTHGWTVGDLVVRRPG